MLLDTITSLLPILAPLAASGVVYVANKILGLIAAWSPFAKRALVVMLTAAFSVGLTALGVDVPAGDLTAWVGPTLEGLVEGVIAAIIYRFGKGPAT